MKMTLKLTQEIFVLSYGNRGNGGNSLLVEHLDAASKNASYKFKTVQNKILHRWRHDSKNGLLLQATFLFPLMT